MCLAGRDFRKASLALVELKVTSTWQCQWKDTWKKKRRKYQMKMIMILSLCGGIKTYLPGYQYFPVVSDVFHHCHQWELCCWLHKAQICASSPSPCASWDKDVLQKRHIYDAYFRRVKVQQVYYTEVSQGQNIQSTAKVPHELHCSRSESGPALSCPRVVLLQLDKQTFLQAWPNQNGSLLFWMQEFDSASQRWQKFLYFTMKLSRRKAFYWFGLIVCTLFLV